MNAFKCRFSIILSVTRLISYGCDDCKSLPMMKGTSDVTRFDGRADAPVQYCMHRPMVGVHGLPRTPLDADTRCVFIPYCPKGRPGSHARKKPF